MPKCTLISPKTISRSCWGTSLITAVRIACSFAFSVPSWDDQFTIAVVRRFLLNLFYVAKFPKNPFVSDLTCDSVLFAVLFITNPAPIYAAFYLFLQTNPFTHSEQCFVYYSFLFVLIMYHLVINISLYYSVRFPRRSSRYGIISALIHVYINSKAWISTCVSLGASVFWIYIAFMLL